MKNQASKTSDELVEILSVVLDRPIAFHPVFADLTGSVLAGLLLSQAVYWMKRAESGWFYKTITQWQEETRLSRHEQETARKTLRKFSFWQEERRGVPAKMYFRVDLAALYSELVNLEDKTDLQSSLPESGNLDCRKAADKHAEKQQTGLPETGKHNKGISETTTEITSETTSETTTTTPLTPLHADPDDPGGSDFAEQCLVGTLLQDADPERIAEVAQRCNLNAAEVETAIDVLDQQYRKSHRTIGDPTALVVSALKGGVNISGDYVPRQDREAEKKRRQEAARKKAEDKRREEEAIEAMYKAADERLLALPPAEYEEIMAAAKAKLPFILRNSKKALWAEAREMIISRARAPA